jgi:hypothetical protein
MPLDYTAKEVAGNITKEVEGLSLRAVGVVTAAESQALPPEGVDTALKSIRDEFDSIEQDARIMSTNLLVQELTTARQAIGRARSTVGDAATEARALRDEGKVAGAAAKLSARVALLSRDARVTEDKAIMAEASALFVDGDERGALVFARAAESAGINGARFVRENIEKAMEYKDPAIREAVDRREAAISDAYAVAQQLRIARIQMLRTVELAARAAGDVTDPSRRSIRNNVTAMKAASERARLSIKVKVTELMENVEAGTPYLGIAEAQLPHPEPSRKRPSDMHTIPSRDAVSTVRS